MNLILLFDYDFLARDTVRVGGRRAAHIAQVHRASVGDRLVVGRLGGMIGEGEIIRIDSEQVEMQVRLEREPPPPVPITLVMALPRPKVMHRVLGALASMGVKQIHLINAWRVEKSYWKTPKLTEEEVRRHLVAGLEQARDTVMPAVTTHRLFRPFVESELPAIAANTLRLVAHPGAERECPRGVGEAVTLAIGPEGGFIAQEIESLQRAGFSAITLGSRILRVETAVAALIGRIF